MNIITVIPIARGIGKETLTYFSKESPLKGCLVEVPVRSKKIYGIVLESIGVDQKKSEIKALAFILKKIDGIQSRPFLQPSFIDAINAVSEYYATTTGAVLSTLVPKIVLDTVTDIETMPFESHTESDHSGEVLALQASDEERFSSYKSLIREEFARKKSVFLCLPNREEIRLAQENLKKGIEQYTYILHNNVSKKEFTETWKQISENPHPVLIIATGYFLSVPRPDISSLIIEKENSRGYAIPKRPYMDFRMIAEIFAKKMKWKVIFGDTALRVETIYKEKTNSIHPFSSLKYRVLTSAETELVDMRTPKDAVKKEFQIIGPHLEELIRTSVEESDTMFLFCARKGLSPLTLCADCGDTVACEHCGSPVVLYGKNEEKRDAHHPGKTNNFYLCHVCGSKRTADILCKRCGSWKLNSVGVGIETIEKEIKKKFPDVTVFVMDKDHVTTHAQALKVIKNFYANPGSILLGTEMALPYLKEKIGMTGIVSLDSFFSIPDFRIKEKIMSIVLNLRDLALKRLIIQTRKPDETVFEYALKGNLSDFYRDELDERKKLGLSPFMLFIKITLEGIKTVVREKMEKLKIELKETVDYDISIFEAFHARRGSDYTVHGLLMVPPETWPDPKLVAKLRSLPPQFLIKIDPDSLL